DRLEVLRAAHSNFRYDIALSGPPIEAGATSAQPVDATGRYRSGMLHEVIAADWPSLEIGKAYLAGPPVMVEAVAALLRGRGVALHDIHADAYYTEAD